MFQYAAGKQLAYMHKTQLKLDKRSYQDDKLRHCAIQYLNIDSEIACNEEIEAWAMGSYLHDRYRKRILWYLSWLYPRHFRDKERGFDSNFFMLKDNIYLEGYFQSGKYFEEIDDKIRHEFEPSFKFSNNQNELHDRIQQSDSVSIHIRRGDFVNNPKICNIYNVCDLNYYENCVKYIQKKINNPVFFIFSDDPQWVIENFKLDCPAHYLAGCNSSLHGADELILMSFCKHNIIANSTFSWWGAWLNKNTSKLVLAPAIWSKDGSDENKITLANSILF